MGKLTFSPTQRKQLLYGLGWTIALVLWSALFLAPQRSALSQRAPRLRTLQRQLKEVRQNLVQLPRFEAELARLSGGNGSSLGGPPEQQLPELLGAIAQMARESQVQLLAVKPKVELGQIVPGSNGFLELPVQVEAQAAYHQIGKFLDVMERSEKFIQVQSIEIRSDPRDIWRHPTTLVLQVYLLPGKEQVKP